MDRVLSVFSKLNGSFLAEQLEQRVFSGSGLDLEQTTTIFVLGQTYTATNGTWIIGAVWSLLLIILTNYLVVKWTSPLPNEPKTIRSMTLLQFIRRAIQREDGPDFLLQLCRIMGDYTFRMPNNGGVQAFVVADPGPARRILLHKASIKTPIFYDFYDRLAQGPTFVAHNGNRASHALLAATTSFSNDNLNVMTRKVEIILEKWIRERLEPIYVNMGKPLDLDQELVGVTTEILCHVAFGYQLNQHEKATLITRLNKARHELLDSTNIFRASSLTSWMFSSTRSAKLAGDNLLDFCRTVLKNHKKKIKDSKKTPLLIDLILQDKIYKDDEERVRDMLMYLYTGYDSAAHTISWAILELSKNYEEQKFLRARLLQDAARETPAKYSPALKNVLRETLRLYSPNSLGSIRTPMVDIPLRDRTKIIPAGSTCVIPYYVLLRNERIFPYADSFVPSRWEQATPQQIASFLPFGAGRRQCPADLLANVEMTSILKRLVSQYQFSILRVGGKDFSLTLRPVGMKLAVRRAPPPS
jgi:cytochrome P450